MHTSDPIVESLCGTNLELTVDSLVTGDVTSNKFWPAKKIATVQKESNTVEDLPPGGAPPLTGTEQKVGQSWSLKS